MLFLVVGPSGVGKDALIGAARQALEAEGFSFPRRWITTAADRGEQHHPLSVEEFVVAVGRGSFALHWHAHDLHYAIGREIDDTLRTGGHVVANVSRTVIEEARVRYGRRRVIGITAPTGIVAERLAARGRESVADIEKRLGRASLATPPGNDVVEFVNDRPLAESAASFVDLLRDVAAGR
jgi:ribose 1,5-bisphosphokinase